LISKVMPVLLSNTKKKLEDSASSAGSEHGIRSGTKSVNVMVLSLAA
jgi:hypothetical protein